MALKLNSLHRTMCREFSTITTDEAFRDDFVQAVNLVLDELSFEADLSTALPHVATFNGDVDDLSERHAFIVHDGLVSKLIEMGRSHRNGENAYALARDNWEERKGDFMVDQSREDQDDVDEDDGSGADIIGLGDKSD